MCPVTIHHGTCTDVNSRHASIDAHASRDYTKEIYKVSRSPVLPVGGAVVVAEVALALAAGGAAVHKAGAANVRVLGASSCNAWKYTNAAVSGSNLIQLRVLAS